MPNTLPRPSTLARAAANRQLVVLVHGIWMHGIVMRVMAQHLRRHGYRTRELSYDFLKRSPAENADVLADALAAEDAERIHVVAHSLGGIVTLHLLDRHPQLPVDKVVLLGSPVRGSGVARQMNTHPLLRPLLGRSVEAGLLGGAPAWRGDRPLGVINGSGKFGLSQLLYGAGEDSDGVVAASETLLDAATDSVLIPRSHSTMLFSRECAELVARFVQTGSFKPR